MQGAIVRTDLDSKMQPLVRADRCEDATNWNVVIRRVRPSFDPRQRQRRGDVLVLPRRMQVSPDHCADGLRGLWSEPRPCVLDDGMPAGRQAADDEIDFAPDGKWAAHFRGEDRRL